MSRITINPWKNLNARFAYSFGTRSNRIVSKLGSCFKSAKATGNMFCMSNSKDAPLGGLRTKFRLSCESDIICCLTSSSFSHPVQGTFPTSMFPPCSFMNSCCSFVKSARRVCESFSQRADRCKIEKNSIIIIQLLTVCSTVCLSFVAVAVTVCPALLATLKRKSEQKIKRLSNDYEELNCNSRLTSEGFGRSNSFLWYLLCWSGFVHSFIGIIVYERDKSLRGKNSMKKESKQFFLAISRLSN